MGEKIDQERRKFIKRIPLIVGASAVIPSLLLPEVANAIVSAKYEKDPKYPSYAYLKYLVDNKDSPDYPNYCNLHFGILKNRLYAFGIDKGEVTGYFDISMTHEIAKVEVDFHHEKESRLITLTEVNLGDRRVYKEYIIQRIPDEGVFDMDFKEFNPKTDLLRLNIPRIVREVLNQSIVSTGVIYNGKKRKFDPTIYGLSVKQTSGTDKTSGRYYPLIFEGNFLHGAILNNIRVFCEKINNKVVPIEIRGDYTIKLGGIIPDSIELRAILQEPD